MPETTLDRMVRKSVKETLNATTWTLPDQLHRGTEHAGDSHTHHSWR